MGTGELSTSDSPQGGETRQGNSSSTAPSNMVPGLLRDEPKMEIESRVEVLRERLEAIEERLRAQDSVDKIASINNAILAANLKSLTERISKLEEKMLTKWDVAKTLSVILVGVAGLVGSCLTIIRFLALWK